MRWDIELEEKIRRLNLPSEIKDRIIEWGKLLVEEKDEAIYEIIELVEAENTEELYDRFYRFIDFGTGGLRGIMSEGPNRINSRTIALITEGVINFLKKEKREKELTACISYDTRNNSKLFAKIAAEVFAGNGIKTYIVVHPSPTPFLSFLVREKKADVGIMITASHNPKEYNGYKVYWSDGGQVVYPYDKAIVEEVKKIKLDIKPKSLSYSIAKEKGLIEEITAEDEERYIETILSLPNQREKLKDFFKEIKVIYTPLFGTGGRFIRKLMEKANIDISYVEEEMKEDGNFPELRVPNPEDINALQKGVKKLIEEKGDILIATDPDADRVGVVVRDNENNIHYLTGNQVASILCEYLLSLKDTKNGYIVKTIVTTELLEEIAKSFGVECKNTLTGFKYIAEKIRSEDGRFLFGAEESIGYLVGDYVRDKDGISASLFIEEALAYLKSIGYNSFVDYLDKLYTDYGYYYEELINLQFTSLKAMDRMQKIMRKVREELPKYIGGLKVLKVWDIKERKEIDIESGIEKENKSLPISDVLVFYLEGGSKFVIRPSGTEPKIKCYIMLKGDSGIEKLKEIANKIKKELNFLKDEDY